MISPLNQILEHTEKVPPAEKPQKRRAFKDPSASGLPLLPAMRSRSPSFSSPDHLFGKASTLATLALLGCAFGTVPVAAQAPQGDLGGSVVLAATQYTGPMDFTLGTLALSGSNTAGFNFSNTILINSSLELQKPVVTAAGSLQTSGDPNTLGTLTIGSGLQRNGGPNVLTPEIITSSTVISGNSPVGSGILTLEGSGILNVGSTAATGGQLVPTGTLTLTGPALTITGPGLLNPGGGAPPFPVHLLSPQIITGTAERFVKEGSPVTLKLGSLELGAIECQWFHNGVAIPGGNGASISLPAVGEDAAGDYSLALTAGGASITLNAGSLSVVPYRGVDVTAQPPEMIRAIRNGQGSVPIALSNLGAQRAVTEYEVLRKNPDGSWLPVPGQAPSPVASGDSFRLPITRVPTSGQFKVKFTRTYADGSVVDTETNAFDVSFSGWETAAGGYEGVLLRNQSDSGTAASVNPRYCGTVSLNISKSGSASGRLQYTEILTDPVSQATVYSPVSRSFAGGLVPIPGDLMHFTLIQKLGAGQQLGREELTLEVDLSGESPVVKVKLLDTVSIDMTSAGGASFPGAVLSKQAAPLSQSAPALPGRYTVASDFAAIADKDSPAYVLTQITPSGRIIWTSRTPGYRGSGTANLTDGANGAYAASFYESCSVNNRTELSATTLTGLWNISKDSAQEAWTVSLGESGFEKLEKQASRVVRNYRPPAQPGATQAATNPVRPTCEVALFDFTGSNGCRWDGNKPGASAGKGMKVGDLFPPGVTMLLKLQDPSELDAAGKPVTYQWNIKQTPRGPAAEGIGSAGTPPPSLILRIDKERGELTGFYNGKSAGRRTLQGVPLPPSADDTRAAGWVESGPGIIPQHAAWELTKPAAAPRQ